jgi:hypothetical protein
VKGWSDPFVRRIRLGTSDSDVTLMRFGTRAIDGGGGRTQIDDLFEDTALEK